MPITIINLEFPFDVRVKLKKFRVNPAHFPKWIYTIDIIDLGIEKWYSPPHSFSGNRCKIVIKTWTLKRFIKFSHNIRGVTAIPSTIKKHSEVNVIKKDIFLFFSIFCLFVPTVALSSPTAPCNVVAYASGNSYLQSPSFAQNLPFYQTSLSFGTCVPTTVTIIVANPPQNPPPNNAPVYMSLYVTAGSDTTYTSQLLVTQGTTVITSSSAPNWFPPTTTTFTGVSIISPSTPWVPGSVTVIWQ